MLKVNKSLKKSKSISGILGWVLTFFSWPPPPPVYSKVSSKKFRTVRPKLSLNWESLNTIKIKQGYAQSGDLEEGSLTFTFSEDSGN